MVPKSVRKIPKKLFHFTGGEGRVGVVVVAVVVVVSSILIKLY